MKQRNILKIIEKNIWYGCWLILIIIVPISLLLLALNEIIFKKKSSSIENYENRYDDTDNCKDCVEEYKCSDSQSKYINIDSEGNYYKECDVTNLKQNTLCKNCLKTTKIYLEHDPNVLPGVPTPSLPSATNIYKFKPIHPFVSEFNSQPGEKYIEAEDEEALKNDENPMPGGYTVQYPGKRSVTGIFEDYGPPAFNSCETINQQIGSPLNTKNT